MKKFDEFSKSKKQLEEEYYKLYGGLNIKNPPFEVGTILKQIWRIDDNDNLIKDGREVCEFMGMKGTQMLLKTLNSDAAYSSDIINPNALKMNKKLGYNPEVGQILQLHYMYADRYEIINNSLNESIDKIESNKLETSVKVENNRNILNWFVDNQTKSFQNNQKVLSQTLLSELKTLFGEANKSLKLENPTKVYILKYKDLTFNVFTANNRGTDIEIVGYTFDEIRNRTKEKEIIEFLEELHKIINFI